MKHRKYMDEQNKPRFPSHSHDSTVEQCYPNLPEDMFEDNNPLNLENIKEKKYRNEKLMQSVVKYPEWYSYKSINDVKDILCDTKPGYWTFRKQEALWKIRKKIPS
jgi:hypothetical protein